MTIDPEPSYAELDVTTNFTFLRGGSHGEELVKQAAALGYAAIAVADANTLAGVVRAHIAAKEAGIQFIVGARLILEDAPSLLAYPTSRAAYGRLCRLLTRGQRRAEKGECILFLTDVTAHAEGLIFIALRGGNDPGDENQDDARFEKELLRLKQVLKTPLYLAAHYSYRGDDRIRIEKSVHIANRTHIPLIATGAVSYTHLTLPTTPY